MYIYSRGVCQDDISRPARKIFISARHGPQSMYYKMCIVNFFNILQHNQYNNITLHSNLPLVHKLYSPSTTVMNYVQLYQ